MAKTSPFQVGDQVEGYRITAKIGAGGMGEIYEAWEAELNRQVAIKIISESALENKNAVDRFLSEGRALAKLSNPHVVSVYRLGTYKERPFIAMEYIQGLPLNEFLLVHPCGVPDLIEIFKQIATGLMAAHQAGIVHRDLKPHNILVDDKLQAKLIDFGIAKVYSEEASLHTTANVFIGTVNYSAPEVLKGQPATTKSDIFSLGLVLYHMMTGETPFAGSSQLEVMENVRVQELGFSKNQGLYYPEDLQKIFRKMTLKTPDERYARIEDVLADLQKLSLKEVPSELKTATRNELEIKNKDHLYSELRKAAFTNAEARFIVGLAVDMEFRRSLEHAKSSDATVSLEFDRAIHVPPTTLAEAIKRFREMRSRLITQQISKKPQQVPIPPPVQKKFRLPMIYAGSALSLLFALMIFFFWPSPGGRAPVFKVGQSHSMRVRLFTPKGEIENLVETFTIQKVMGARYVWRSDKKKVVEQSQNLFLPPYDFVNVWGDGSVMTERNTISGHEMDFFPLRVGKKMSVNVVGSRISDRPEDHPPEHYHYVYSCEVLAKESVKIEIGSRDTYKVHCAAKGTNNFSRIYNYDSQLGRIVMLQLESDDKYFEEMISYNF